MKIIIVGAGKVGYSLCEQLSREDHDIIVIDTDAKLLEEAQQLLDIMVIQGNGASLEVLKSAGVQDTDVLIACTNADEINLLCCISAKKLGCKHTIARVRNPEYNQQIAFLREQLGLSLSINPEQTAAQEIYRLIQFPLFLKRDSFDKGRVELVELKVDEGGKLEGKRIMDVTDILGLHVLVCAVERGDQVFIPNGRFELKANDRVTVTAARSDLAKLIKSLDIVSKKIRYVVIVGGSKVAEYLTEELEKSGVEVTLIEKDEEVCTRFSQRFPKQLVIHGDASRKGFLESQGVGRADAVIALTGIDEENLIISMYVGRLGVEKTVSKIDRTEYAKLFSDTDIGSIVCPKDLVANEIVRYIRAKSNSGEGSVRSLHRIVNGKVEALEFLAPDSATYFNVPLSKLNVRQNVLIACISRNYQIIIPRGDDCIKPHDIIIAVTDAEHPISDLKDIFEKDAVKAE